MSVGDFGVGTGMLSIACSLIGASDVVGFDVDQSALEIARANFSHFDIDNIDLVQCDVQSLSLYSGFDCVVMNPPFGTRNKGIDSLFVEKAMSNAAVVYSLHKTSTRDFFVKKAAECNWGIEVLAELKYDIPKTHKFHKQKSKDIEVDLIRLFHT